MSQHDFDIANAAGASVRADVNLAFQALASQSSGATEPATKYAYQLWADTSAGKLKIRNGANNAWVEIGTLDQVNLALLPLTGGTLTGALTLAGDPAAALHAVPSRALAGHIAGLVPANNGTDANNDIDVSVGRALKADGSLVARLTATMTKRLDAAWAQGTGQGGLFTGAKAAGTWYHGILIRADADGAVDWGFDTSVAGANKPAGWTVIARLFSCRTDGSSNLMAFQAVEAGGGGLEMNWKTSQIEWTNSSLTVDTWTTKTLAYVPPSVPCLGRHGYNVGSAYASTALLSARPTGSTEANGTANGRSVLRTNASAGANAVFDVLHTGLGSPSFDAHVSVASFVAASSHNWGAYTNGWLDFRRAA